MTTAAQDPLALHNSPATPAKTKKDTEKKTIQVAFESADELALYDKIVAAADADERSPSNFLRIWLKKNYE